MEALAGHSGGVADSVSAAWGCSGALDFTEGASVTSGTVAPRCQRDLVILAVPPVAAHEVGGWVTGAIYGAGGTCFCRNAATTIRHGPVIVARALGIAVGTILTVAMPAASTGTLLRAVLGSIGGIARTRAISSGPVAASSVPVTWLVGICSKRYVANTRLGASDTVVTVVAVFTSGCRAPPTLACTQTSAG